MNFSDAAKSLCGARHRPPDAAIERGDHTDRECGGGDERCELAPSESVAAQVDLERRDAQTGREGEADCGRREQRVGRRQTDVDPAARR